MRSLLFAFLIASIPSMAREKARIIKVESMDGKVVTGHMTYWNTYIVEMTLKKAGDSSALGAYYFKVADNTYRIEVQHIKTIVVVKGRGAVNAALRGAALGAITVSGAALTTDYYDTESALMAAAGAMVVGACIGAPVGLVTSLMRHGKIVVNGVAVNMNQMSQYYKD